MNTGNWEQFKQTDNGTTWTQEQFRTNNAVNELTRINSITGNQWATPVYDANGNMTAIPRPQLDRTNWANFKADEWGVFTSEQWSEFESAPKFLATYDAWNRLVKLTDGGTGEPIHQYQYDGRGYRTIVKTYDESGTLEETRHAYFTDQWQCVEERVDSSSTPDRQLIWGIRYIDDLILRDKGAERLYALQDGNWNVTAVVDDTGSVQERYEYDPYGNTTVLSPTFSVRATSSYGWETTYCGYRWDEESGLFAVRNRYYSPVLGIWVTRDPDPASQPRSSHVFSVILEENHIIDSHFVLWPEELHRESDDSLYVNTHEIDDVIRTSRALYVYVGDNPVTHQDGFGLDWLDCMVECMERMLITNQIAAGATTIVGVGGYKIKKKLVIPGQKEDTALLTKISQRVGGPSYKVTSAASKLFGRLFLILGVADAGIEVYCAGKCSCS